MAKKEILFGVGGGQGGEYEREWVGEDRRGGGVAEGHEGGGTNVEH